MSRTNLLGSTSRVETPYIKVQIGNYIFGVYHEENANVNNQGVYTSKNIIYPNYVKSLNVTKINGQVNEYTLNLFYVVTPDNDPNFFEKVFSSVSKTRKIIFSYGDMSLPTYVYKNEEAIITSITTSFNIKSGIISYVVNATSSATLGYSGCYTFEGGDIKPSERIKQVLENKNYGLQEIFYGMTDLRKVDSLGLIPAVDSVVTVPTKTNISALDYVKYLVDCMIPAGSQINSNQQKTFYCLKICDEVTGQTIGESLQTANIVTETLGGPYFQIVPVTKYMDHSDAYEIDIGYPTANVVLSFGITNNENYSIYYDWQQQLNSEDYVMRLDDNGEWYKEYAPVVSSKNKKHFTNSAEKTWWTKITEYPISATITIKGLLRPATLMQYVKLNVLFFGNKHISSGMYIVTKQQDQIDASGYRTTLTLTRISGESEEDY